MNFNLQNSVKLEILNKTKLLIEPVLYEELLQNGFDPEQFDPDTFVPDEDSIHHRGLSLFLQKYQNIVRKISELQG
jgi:hypothetical protein